MQSESGSEADCSECPQPVLAHSFRGRTDRAQYPTLEINLTLKRITDFISPRMKRDGVDGEVAPSEVFLQRRAEFHHRMTAIRAHVTPEGGDFVHHVPLHNYPDRAELHAQRNGPLKNARYLPGRRGGRKIPVQMLFSNKRISYRTPHAPGLEAGSLKARDYFLHRGRCMKPIKGSGKVHSRRDLPTPGHIPCNATRTARFHRSH